MEVRYIEVPLYWDKKKSFVRFVISRFHCTGIKNIVRYTEDFVI